MHGRVVTGGYHQAAVGTGHGRSHERIRAHVEAHVLEAHQGAFAGIGHAQGTFHGRFLVTGPVPVHVVLPRKRVQLDVFRDFCGGSAGIGINARQTGMQGPQSQGFISQK